MLTRLKKSRACFGTLRINKGGPDLIYDFCLYVGVSPKVEEYRREDGGGGVGTRNHERLALSVQILLLVALSFSGSTARNKRPRAFQYGHFAPPLSCSCMSSMLRRYGGLDLVV